MISRSWKSSAYQWREKPFHTTLLLPALKEKTMSRKMGAYRKKKDQEHEQPVEETVFLLQAHSITACSSPSPKWFMTHMQAITMSIITRAMALPRWGL